MSTVIDTESTDRIERSIVIHAARPRVWKALSDAQEFGTWFGADLSGQTFAPGNRVRALVTNCGHDDVWFDAVIDRVEPQTLLSFRWHPYPLDPAVDYASEEPTLVTFTLEDTADGGTLLTVVESGFDKVPPHRRLEAFRMNSRGWDWQIGNVVRHVTA